MERAINVKPYFKSELCIGCDNKWMISLNYDVFPATYTSGSMAILPARIMGISYANYCRMCRDMLGAEIYGKNCMYLSVHFPSKENADKLVTLLNKRMSYIMERKDN